MILAGISINAIVGDDGLIKKAQKSANLSNEAEAKETVNRAILEFYASSGYKTLNEFLQTKVEKGTIDSVTENSDGTLTISKNGYEVTVENKKAISSSKTDGTQQGSIIALSVTPYTGTYDGQVHNAITSVTVSPNDAKIEYSIDGTNFSTTMPTILNASSISVVIKASKTGYTTKTSNAIAMVEKAEGKIILSETSSTLDYPSSKTVTVSESSGTLSVESSDTSVVTASVSGNIITIQSLTEGTAIITIKSEANTNYTEKIITYSVTVKKPEFTEDSGVGYYADVDNDGTVDGIIFEDFKKGGSGTWGSGSYNSYTITKNISDNKSYYISQQSYNGAFGIRPVLAPIESENENKNDRFYVMALNDYSYVSIYKAKTATSGKWATLGINEWAAFGGEIGITSSNYSKYGLKDRYWSVNLFHTDTDYGLYANFSSGNIDYNSPSYLCYVRLARTF